MKLLIFLLCYSINYCVTNSPEIDLSPEDKIYAHFYHHQKAISQAKSLLNSSKKMDPLMAKALKAAMKNTIRNSECLQKSISLLKNSPLNSKRTDDIVRYARTVRNQGEAFSRLAVAAQKNKIDLFNNLCLKIFSHTENLEQLEKKLKI